MIPLTSLAWQEVEGEDGVVRKVPMVPSWGMVLEYLIKSSTGHPSTPKGGTPEYRNGPQYKLVYGVPQGERMGEKKRYGYGGYAEKKMRFVTIEQLGPRSKCGTTWSCRTAPSRTQRATCV